MNRSILLSIGFLFIAVFSVAQLAKKDENADMFYLKGSLYEIDHLEEPETKTKAKDVQVIIYQDKDIYVAFYTLPDMGSYEFYLPVGHEYEIHYGGNTFVNKIIYVDSRQFPNEKKPRTVKLDIGLFRPIEGYGFEMMKEPFARIKYNPEMDIIEPDMDYTEMKADQVDRYFKKIKKEQRKKFKTASMSEKKRKK